MQNNDKDKKKREEQNTDTSFYIIVILLAIISVFVLIFIVKEHDQPSYSNITNPVSTQSELMRSIISGTQTAMASYGNIEEITSTPNSEATSIPTNESNSTKSVEGLEDQHTNQSFEYRLNNLENTLKSNDENLTNLLRIQIDNLDKQITIVNTSIVDTNKRIDTIYIFLGGTFIIILISLVTVYISISKINKE